MVYTSCIPPKYSGVVLEIRFGFESFRGNFVFTMEEYLKIVIEFLTVIMISSILVLEILFLPFTGTIAEFS